LHTISANALETFAYLVYSKVLIIFETPKKAVSHWEKFEGVGWGSFAHCRQAVAAVRADVAAVHDDVAAVRVDVAAVHDDVVPVAAQTKWK